MKSITFDTPLQSSGKTFASVNMRFPTVGDEEDAQVMAVDLDRGGILLTAELCLFSLLTGIPYDDLRSMPSYEIKKFRKAYHEMNAPRPTARGTTRGNATAREKPRENPDDTDGNDTTVAPD